MKYATGVAAGLILCCLALDVFAQAQGQVLQPVTRYGQARQPAYTQPTQSDSPFFGSGSQATTDTSPFFRSDGYVKGADDNSHATISPSSGEVQNAPDVQHVVVTIKPLHSLVAAVMDGSGQTPLLLVTGTLSPHTFQLAPSQVSELQNADVVFAIGAGMEPFLPSVDAVLPERTQRVNMAEQQGMFLLPMRGNFNADATSTGLTDPHIWMDPTNALAMVDVIAQTLSSLYPENAGIYRSNAENLKDHIQALNQDVASQMAALKGQHFIVFHDGLQYFEHAFGVQAVGAITLAQEPLPGAEHLAQLRTDLSDGTATCVLTEPQYKGQIVNQLVAGTQAKVGVMDPEAILLDPGPMLYLNLISYTADQVSHCLQ